MTAKTKPDPLVTTYSIECPVCEETLVAQGKPLGENTRRLVLAIHREHCKGEAVS